MPGWRGSGGWDAEDQTANAASRRGRTAEGIGGVLAGERRGALPALAAHAPIGRRVGIPGPARGRRNPHHVGAVVAPVDCRGARLGKQRGVDVPEGRGNASAPVDRGPTAAGGGIQRSSAGVPDRAALRDERPHRPRGALAIRLRHLFGDAAAQLGRCGIAADRIRVRRGHPVHMARPGGARREQLVCHRVRWAAAPLARRLVGRARQHALVPVPVPALVLPVLHLGAFPVASVAHGFEPGTGASGRHGWVEISRLGTARLLRQSCWRSEPCSPE